MAKHKKKVRSFMGLAGYYRDFIPSFVKIAAPLSDVTRKGQPHKVEWGEAQEKAYQTIKSYLTSEPILRLPDPAKTFVTDGRLQQWNWCSIDAKAR